MIAFSFGDGGDDSDVIAFGTDIVGRRDNCDIDICNRQTRARQVR